MSSGKHYPYTTKVNSSTSINKCIQCIKDTINIDENDLIIGVGSKDKGSSFMAKKIKAFHSNIIDDTSFIEFIKYNKSLKGKKTSKAKKETDEKTFDDEKVKTLKSSVEKCKKKERKIHIIGNFTVRIGIKKDIDEIKCYITNACKIADTISFIMPTAFTKPSMHRQFASCFHLEKQSEITMNGAEKGSSIPYIFQIWEKKGEPRTDLDIYYTKPAVANKCIDTIRATIDIDENDLIVEPSAGDGSFMDGIKSLNCKSAFFDVEPANDAIIRQDFLELDLKALKKSTNTANIHIVGNPPFGRQSSLAIKFIKHAVKHCSSISFILPKTFKKLGMHKLHIDKQFHLIVEEDIEEDAFLLDNEDEKYDVPCVFQIWVKKDEPRPIQEKLKPNHYEFVSAVCGKNKYGEDVKIPPTDADISFRRVGCTAGEIDTVLADKSTQSHYFIKFAGNIFNTTLFNKLSKIKFNSSDDTVGAKSISKQELIAEYNKVVAKD
jgi:predicted RNA methylase